MLSLTSLTVSSYDVDKLTVTWTFKNTSESLSNYSIDVYRGESPSTGTSEYTVVGSGISANTASFDDTTISGIYHPTRTWFYKLKLTNNLTSETSLLFDNTPAYVKSYTTDRPTLEIIRRKKLVVDKYAGRDVKILRRRTYGTRCSLCWDTTLSRRTLDDDTECYGTGITGGFFSHISHKGIITASPKFNQITMFGEWMPSDCMLTVVGVPPLKTNDVVVDDTNKRWSVKSVRTIEKGGIIIEQICQLTLIAPSDLIYQIGVV